MAPLCSRRHRFPPEIIQYAIWLYLRFTRSYIETLRNCWPNEGSTSPTKRRWVLKFGPPIARRLRQRRPAPSDRSVSTMCWAPRTIARYAMTSQPGRRRSWPNWSPPTGGPCRAGSDRAV